MCSKHLRQLQEYAIGSRKYSGIESIETIKVENLVRAENMQNGVECFIKKMWLEDVPNSVFRTAKCSVQLLIYSISEFENIRNSLLGTWCFYFLNASMY